MVDLEPIPLADDQATPSAAEVPEAEPPNICSVHANDAMRNVVETKQERRDRGLAGARVPDERPASSDSGNRSRRVR